MDAGDGATTAGSRGGWAGRMLATVGGSLEAGSGTR